MAFLYASFGEIRAFSGSEVGNMQSELDRIARVISQKSDDLLRLQVNPLNYLLGPQRDALTRLSNGLDQDKGILQQLSDSRDATIESGDTDKLQKWMDLAATVGSANDLAIWNENKSVASTANMVTTVASDTASDVKQTVSNPFGIPWYYWLIGGVGLLVLLKRR